LGLTAFVFTFREKDYGGIHLALRPESMPLLLTLMDELEEQPLGHSRRVPLLPTPEDVPRSIAARTGHRPLQALRIGSAADGVTRITIEKDTGLISLSPGSRAEFRRAVAGTAMGVGDTMVAGDSDSWTDRVWLWPMHEQKASSKRVGS
jgi:hypothetical protein